MWICKCVYIYIYICVCMYSCLVAKSCSILCYFMNCSTPGFPVLHYLLEFAQTHFHWVHDAIQPFHPLLPPSPVSLSLPSIRVFSSKSALCIRCPKYTHTHTHTGKNYIYNVLLLTLVFSTRILSSIRVGTCVSPSPLYQQYL